jgi:hypothetical protein
VGEQSSNGRRGRDKDSRVESAVSSGAEQDRLGWGRRHGGGRERVLACLVSCCYCSGTVLALRVGSTGPSKFGRPGSQSAASSAGERTREMRLRRAEDCGCAPFHLALGAGTRTAPRVVSCGLCRGLGVAWRPLVLSLCCTVSRIIASTTTTSPSSAIITRRPDIPSVSPIARPQSLVVCQVQATPGTQPSVCSTAPTPSPLSPPPPPVAALGC